MNLKNIAATLLVFSLVPTFSMAQQLNTPDSIEALLNYKKSLDLNPGNKNAAERIKILPK